MPHTYEPRTEECSECFEGYYEVACGPGYVSHRCDTCDGTGEIDCACCECQTVCALNEDGECERCADSAELTYEQFLTKYRAHERLLDLTVESLGGGRHRVSV